MTRFAWLALLLIAACSHMSFEKAGTRAAYTGTVQKVFQVVRGGVELPGLAFLGNAGRVLGPALRQNAETQQYIVRTPRGQIIVQSDDEFAVGQCVEVIPQVDRSGPAFRYGEATVVPSASCRG